MNLLTKIILTLFFLFSYCNVNSQIWKKIKDKAENAFIKKAEKEIDKTLDSETSTENNSEKKEKITENDISAAPLNLWRNFKFIPGEKVIFYDNLKFEEVGEFPSRWDLINGNAEVALLNNEKVILFTAKNRNTIKPLFKKTGYLGDEFTIEYDVLIPNFYDEKIRSMRNQVYFDSNVRQKNIEIEFDEYSKKLSGWASNSKFKIEDVEIGNQNEWHHISISYYKGKFKMYYDDKRISNIPNFDMYPEIFALNVWCYYSGKKQHPYLVIKNIRIAHGGGEMYKRIIADGKYETNGILFNPNKTKIKPQSMGIINKIVTILEENKNWKMDIIGYTDSDGEEVTNLKLSENRAKSVKEAIIEQGIEANRLTVIGKGEANPLNTNNTPEEKANNRRVAFIKK